MFDDTDRGDSGLGKGLAKTAAFVVGTSVAGPIGGLVARAVVDVLMD